MSALVGLECSLGDEVLPLWANTPPRLILTLLLNVFNTLTTAMRYEPANAKFFHQEASRHSFLFPGFSMFLFIYVLTAS